MMKADREIRNLLKVMFTVLAVVILAGMISLTAYGSDKEHSAKAMESYYRAMEKQYISDIREGLNELGYTNAGVMLNRIVDDEGNNVYTLKINHRKLEGVSEAEIMDKLNLQDLVEGRVICVMTSI